MSGELWRLGKVWLTGRTRGPVYLIHSVTERCNLACPHCFVGAARDEDRELSVQEIEAVARRLPREAAFVLLTGGEPFLRSDLPEIVAAYAGPGGVPHVEIATNGWLTDRVARGVERVLRENPSLRLTVSLSLDGLGVMHDRTRGRAGAFSRARATAHALREIQTREPRLHRSVNVTVSAANQATLDDLLAYLVDEVGGPAVTCTLVRGAPRDPATANVNLGRYRRFMAALTRARTAGQLAGIPGPLGSFVEAQMDLSAGWVAQVASGRPAPGPCYAGRLSGLLCADGTVRACELRPAALGNVRTAGYDLAHVWASEIAHTERVCIRAGRCACTHECFIVCNILFNPRFWPALLAGVFHKSLARTRAGDRQVGGWRYESGYCSDEVQQERPWQHPAGVRDGG